MVSDNRRATPLGGVHTTKIGGMWNLKHYIRSPTFYELLIKKNSMATLLWTSGTSKTISRCVSMQIIYYNKTFLLITSPSKDTLSLDNN